MIRTFSLVTTLVAAIQFFTFGVDARTTQISLFAQDRGNSVEPQPELCAGNSIRLTNTPANGSKLQRKGAGYLVVGVCRVINISSLRQTPVRIIANTPPAGEKHERRAS